MAKIIFSFLLVAVVIFAIYNIVKFIHQLKLYKQTLYAAILAIATSFTVFLITHLF